MTPLFEAAAELQTFFARHNWKSCIIGGIALLRWGEPRFTRDVDVTLLTGFGREADFIEPILLEYRGRISDAAQFALRNRVLLIESRGKVPVDIAFGGLPFEVSLVERATAFEFEPGCALRTCSAEDLIVQKLFASRPRDILDVETVVLREGKRLDWAYIEHALRPLAEIKDEPAILELFFRLRQTQE